MRYYIADNHFHHAKMNTAMDKRGFESLEAMHDYMIKQWNSVVRKNDEVVILGDFSLGKGEETNGILRQLNGKKFLVNGGHDKFLQDRKFDQSLFQWIKPYAEMHDDGRKVVLCHYPIFCYNGQFRTDKDGKPITWMLHGHTHLTEDQELVEQFKDITRSTLRKSKYDNESKTIPVQMIDCFCMLSDYKPLTLDQWIEMEQSGVIKDLIDRKWYYSDNKRSSE